jgi:hypothetical protein
MPTDTAQVSPAVRQDPRQVANTLKKRFQYNTPGIATGVAFDNSLPANAVILAVLVEIITVFNAVTTNVVTVGTNSPTFNDLVAAADVNEAAVATTRVERGIGGSIMRGTADKVPKVMYTQSGTAATTGDAEVTILYEGGWAS